MLHYFAVQLITNQYLYIMKSNTNNSTKKVKTINKATIAKAVMTAKWREDQISFTALCDWATGKGKAETSDWLKQSKANGKKNVPTLAKCSNKQQLSTMLRILDEIKVEKFVPTEERPNPRLHMTMADGSMRRRFTPYNLQIAVNNWDQYAIDAALDKARKAKK
tara:strand:- start:96 stop:587 length:492 start_codon:yes stop_codon:yes gene_type:complete